MPFGRACLPSVDDGNWSWPPYGADVRVTVFLYPSGGCRLVREAKDSF